MKILRNLSAFAAALLVAASGRAFAAAAGFPHIIDTSNVAVPKTGDTNETTLATITIPGGAVGNNGYVEVETVWSVTNNANAKTPRVRAGGVSGTAYFAPSAFTSIAGCRHLARIGNRNSASSQVGGLAAANSTGVGTASAAPPTSSVNTANDWDIVISAQLGVGSDTLTLESYTVRIFYKA